MTATPLTLRTTVREDAEAEAEQVMVKEVATTR
eukprot:CAMPEP_0173162650 /NCGR_PEP_ID=MMETSP1105-20130129/19441_1 /TAXON_ID=2985 /ORGANISM="Ochromonas sp., Strain BG-1" /LENGTH=32 /DNA_ID= /DNA_START= /DNA_END= /DNA_ORIENTATION=